MEHKTPRAVGCAGCGGCGAKGPTGCAGCSGCGLRPWKKPQLSQTEAALLDELASVLYLPMGQFILLPPGADYVEGTVVLSPVLLETAEDTLETVMERANTLVSLARKGLISLDFWLPITGYSYESYYRSALFREFSTQFRSHPDGKPILRRGSIAITQQALNQLEL